MQTVASYSATAERVAVVASATDVFCLRGSATKTVEVQGIRVSGSATANTLVPVSITKRTTANTGGTSASAPAVAHDSLDPAATATAVAYTANPSALGTSPGDLRGESLIFAGGSSPNLNIGSQVFRFTDYPSKHPRLHGVAEQICVNLNGTTVGGGLITVDMQWTESTP
ncbi:MAG: hypothetical protein AAGL98_00210 [Planctomycetota bacterium]